jgi:hypothetical protein
MNKIEETASIDPFHSHTSIFSDDLYHQSRIATTIDSISDINQIDIDDGLKESLIESGFDLETLNTASERTAKILGIELYVAKLIHNAALKQYRSTTSQVSSLHKYGKAQNQQ